MDEIVRYCMKFIKQFLNEIVNTKLGWLALSPIAKLGVFLFNAKHAYDHPLIKDDATSEILVKIFQNRKVLHGPFQGMEYPNLESVGSTLYPKLIGSYEMELHPIIEHFCKQDYSEIINIGCGEGYYAVGLGLRNSKAKMYAFDLDSTARNLCEQMAKLNRISDHIIIDSICTPQMLENFQFTGSGLIVCDCEGYESELFSESNLPTLSNCDILIETHDFIDINISSRLSKLFSKTHTIKVIKSLDDIEKAKTYSFPETDHLDLNAKKILFREGRPAIMEWLVMMTKESK
jgi:Methyltransferase small domain